MSNEGIFDKVKDFLTGHPEQAGQGLDRAEHLVNERTGGTYSQQVTQGGDMVRQQLGVDDGPPDGQPGPTRMWFPRRPPGCRPLRTRRSRRRFRPPPSRAPSRHPP